MGRGLLLGLALACLVGQTNATAAPSYTPQTVTVRVFNTTPRPGSLELLLAGDATANSDESFYAIFGIGRDGPSAGRVVDARVYDVPRSEPPSCSVAPCDDNIRNRRIEYPFTVDVKDRYVEYYVVLRSIRPVIKVSGRGWSVQRGGLVVERKLATDHPAGSRSVSPFGWAVERFAGAATASPSRRSVAFAILPCDIGGVGTASLRAVDRTIAPLTCDDDRGVAHYVPERATFSVVGNGDGCTWTTTRLLVVGVR